MPKEKDAAERQLENYNDVFADICNVLLFNGKQVIQPEELSDAQPVSQFKADGALHQEERDEAKYWNNSTIIIGMLGAENQTAVDPAEPLRVIAYDGEGYKTQLIRREEAKRAGKPAMPFYPVVTLVLNFSNRRWTGKRSLRECLAIPSALEPYVQDYQIHVFDIAYLSEEQVAMFRSDFRIFAEYLVQRRTRKEYQPSELVIRHVDALFKLMDAVTGTQGFMEELHLQRQKGKEPNMVMGFLEERSLRDRAEAAAKARVEARVEAYANAVRALKKSMGLSDEEAMDKLLCTPEERERCRAYLLAHNAS